MKSVRKTAHRKGGIRRRLGVLCLVTTNPLALPELTRMTAACPMRVKCTHVDLMTGCDVHEVRVPHASVYLIDSWSTGPATEALVGGLRARHPGAGIIVLMPKVTEAASLALMNLGVKGLVAQKDIEAQLADAAVAVAQGGVWMPRRLMSVFLDRVVNHAQETRRPAREATPISQRERQVLDRVVRNLSNKEIGQELNISESTVKFHMNRLLHKFKARRRIDLIVQSYHAGNAVH